MESKRNRRQFKCVICGKECIGGNNAKRCAEHRKPMKEYYSYVRKGSRGRPPSDLCKVKKEMELMLDRARIEVKASIDNKVKILNFEEKQRIAKSMGLEMAA